MRIITLTQGRCAIVDDDDYDRIALHKWCLHRVRNNIYAKRAIAVDGKHVTILMHREILSEPVSFGIDHWNNIGLDNRKSNLRICDQSLNQANQDKRRTTATSTFKGVSWCTRDRKWTVRLTVDRKCRNLGNFDSEVEAARAYNAAAIAAFGEFAKLNSLPQKELA